MDLVQEKTSSLTKLAFYYRINERNRIKIKPMKTLPKITLTTYLFVTNYPVLVLLLSPRFLYTKLYSNLFKKEKCLQIE